MNTKNKSAQQGLADATKSDLVKTIQTTIIVGLVTLGIYYLLGHSQAIKNLLNI